MTPEELSDRLMDHTQSPYHFGRLETATHRGVASNPTCGDSVEVEIRVGREGVIEEAWFKSKGCLLCCGCSSILMEHIEGKAVERVLKLTPLDVLTILGVPLAPLRQRCGTLAIYGIRQALNFSIESTGQCGES